MTCRNISIAIPQMWSITIKTSLQMRDLLLIPGPTFGQLCRSTSHSLRTKTTGVLKSQIQEQLQSSASLFPWKTEEIPYFFYTTSCVITSGVPGWNFAKPPSGGRESECAHTVRDVSESNFVGRVSAVKSLQVSRFNVAEPTAAASSGSKIETWQLTRSIKLATTTQNHFRLSFQNKTQNGRFNEIDFYLSLSLFPPSI